MIQLVSQVFPSSGENACSQRADRGQVGQVLDDLHHPDAATVRARL